MADHRNHAMPAQTVQHGLAVLAVAVAAWPAQAWAQGYPLNDSGQTQCFDAGHAATACNAAVAGRPGQDGRFGRDAAAVAGVLVKQGGGEGGFDFSRVCMNGDTAGTGACAATPVAHTGASPAATDWACTRDNVTGLMWSLQSRLAFWADAATPAFADAGHNGVGRCGYSTGWRLPTEGELLSIVTYGGSSPAIDQAYFPATEPSAYWTATPFPASANAAWAVRFTDGDTSAYNTLSASYVRLVRSQP